MTKLPITTRILRGYVAPPKTKTKSMLTLNYDDTNYSHARFLIEQRHYWTALFNAEASSVVLVLENYMPAPSHVFVQPFAFRDCFRRTIAMSLYRKNDIGVDGVCAAVSHLPVNRAERRRTLREIRGGKDILRLTLDDTDESLAIAVLAAVGHAAVQ
jgi:hypothetical protein